MSGMEKHTSVPAMIDGVRRILRTRAYSPRSVQAYLAWIERFLRFHDGPHWKALTRGHAESFLHHLASDVGLSPNSRNQAASALAFLYREVLGSDALEGMPRARGLTTVPVVLSHREAMRVLNELRGRYQLVASLMYGAGLRVTEAVSLRVKDLDFDLGQIAVRAGKGAKDRMVPLPQRARPALQRQCATVQHLHGGERREGRGWASLPGALHRKDPAAGYSLGWQFAFPARSSTRDETTGRFGHWHMHASSVQRQVKAAVRRSGILKNATSHTFRHSFATQLLRDGVDARTVQRLMGHNDLRTTMVYLHAIDQVGLSVRSPLDRPTDPRGRD